MFVHCVFRHNAIIAHMTDYRTVFTWFYMHWETKIVCNLFHCDIQFIVVWNWIPNISKVCLYMNYAEQCLAHKYFKEIQGNSVRKANGKVSWCKQKIPKTITGFFFFFNLWNCKELVHSFLLSPTGKHIHSEDVSIC